MSDQSEQAQQQGQQEHEPGPELGQDDAFVGEAPAGDANPGDYMSTDQQAGTSEETGTSYARTGETESTPYDEIRAEDATEDEVPG